jgi:hypothetical protein
MEQLKKISPAFYGVIILLFFLPFVNLSCSGQTIMSLSGYQLITGAEYSGQNMFGQDMSGGINNAKTKEKREIDAQPLALFALLAAIVGLAVSFIRKKFTALLNLIISGLGAIFLILLKFNMDSDVKLSGQGVITLDYQAGYWLTILIFICSAVVFWLIFNEKTAVSVVTTETPLPPITQ